jgi:hypothetical protein
VSWDAATDAFIPPTAAALAYVAGALGLDASEFSQQLQQRSELLGTLAQGRGVGMSAMRRALEDFLATPEQALPTSDSSDTPE